MQAFRLPVSTLYNLHGPDLQSCEAAQSLSRSVPVVTLLKKPQFG